MCNKINALREELQKYIDMFSLKEFFNPKYEILSCGYGIGAVSIITPFQTITALNPISKDLGTGISLPGLGSHQLNFTRILQAIYEVEELDSTNYLKWPNWLRERLKQNIKISYINQESANVITIECPKSITLSQFEQLKQINENLLSLTTNNDMFSKNEKPIEIEFLTSTNDFYTINNLDEVMKYAELMIDDSIYLEENECIIGVVCSNGKHRC